MTSQRTVPSLLSRLLRLACRILIFFPRLYLRLLVRLLPMEWLGRAKISFTHHPNPISILEKDGRRTDLVKICKATVPRCQMNPLLPNGNIQTMWTATKNHGPHIYYRRRVFEADHSTYHGTFAVDFVVDPFEGEDDSLPPRTVYFSDAEFEGLSSDDSRPMLIVLHGLSGGSHEVYLRYAIEPLVKGDRKWEICVVNSRGCANSRITSGVLYNARATWDVRQFVRWAREKFPNRPLFGLGFSLGANIMTNYLAEEGHGCLLEAAVVCGNPFNLDLSSKLMQKNFLGKNVYLKVMGTSMRNLALRHKEEIQKFTNLDFERIMKVRYLYEFDREVQCATWGYPTENAYYRDASSCDSVLAIRIPYLAINAADDPIAVKEALPFEEFQQNPYTVLCTTSLGGHLAWFELGGGRWHARPIANFLNHMASRVRLDALRPKVNGMLNSEDDAAVSWNPMRRKMQIRPD